jgi:hypothetical protein
MLSWELDLRQKEEPMRRLLMLSGVLVGLAGCSTPTEPDTQRVIGLIDVGGHPVPTIVAPDTVQVSSWFTATVHTFGNSCTKPDGVELTLTPTEARVTPYDLVHVPADSRTVCTADLRGHPHPVELRFTRAGPAIIVALGEVEVIQDGVARQIPGVVIKQLVVLGR